MNEENRNDEDVKDQEPEASREEPRERSGREEDWKELRRERDEYLDLLQRTRAEFSNYRKRMERERSETCAWAVGEFARAILPVVDDLERALESAEKSGDLKTFLAGVRIIEDHLKKILTEKGITAMEATGKPFDPQYHHAVMTEPHPDLEPGTVSEVLHKGYLMNDRVLRPASVKVVAWPSEVPGETGRPAARESDQADEDVEE